MLNRHETAPNNIDQPKTPNYFRRRLGAAAVALTLFFGAAFGVKETAEGAKNWLKQQWETPVLEEGPDTEVYTAQHGDTVWDIADERTEGDTRKLVHMLQQQPDVKDGLHPGDQLIVPKVNQECPKDN